MRRHGTARDYFPSSQEWRDVKGRDRFPVVKKMTKSGRESLLRFHRIGLTAFSGPILSRPPVWMGTWFRTAAISEDKPPFYMDMWIYSTCKGTSAKKALIGVAKQAMRMYICK